MLPILTIVTILPSYHLTILPSYNLTSLPYPANTGACWSLLRLADLPSRAHEFGHNLGVSHANDQAREYGDMSGVMSFSSQGWKFFSLPSAYALGFIPPDELIDWGGRNGKWVLHDSAMQPDEHPQGQMAIMSPCSTCSWLAGGGGGQGALNT